MDTHSATNRRIVYNPLVKNCSHIFCFQSICVYVFSSIIRSLYWDFTYNYLLNKPIPYQRKISECYCTFSYAAISSNLNSTLTNTELTTTSISSTFTSTSMSTASCENLTAQPKLMTDEYFFEMYLKPLQEGIQLSSLRQKNSNPTWKYLGLFATLTNVLIYLWINIGALP